MSDSSIIDRLAAWGPGQHPGLDAAESLAYCRRLTLGHYENFSVLSGLVPESLRDGASAVYAFCRWSDDLGDEIGDPDRSRELLQWWRQETLDCFAGRTAHPVFVALQSVTTRHDLQPQPFLDLIDAFLQDQEVTRYRAWDDLLDYCRRSADPVGRLVLRLANCDHDPDALASSDAICTALQLTNHWQDVQRDVLDRDRIYIPAECHDIPDFEARLRRTVEDGHAPDQTFFTQWRNLMKNLVDRTWPGFNHLDDLLGRVPAEVRPMIWLFAAGGAEVLRRIEQINYETVLFRPRLGVIGKVRLLRRARRATRGVA